MDLRTLVHSWIAGELVGRDEFGNHYFRARRARLHGRERRWVLFRGKAEASKVPPEWHAWLHHTTDAPLTESAAGSRPWQKEHLPNLTGTTAAYRPAGHDLKGGQRARATGDYEPWTPE